MTDFEMTRLCAEAMGMSKNGPIIEHGFMQVIGPYDPLHDYAQAMALVKRFDLEVRPPRTHLPGWRIVYGWRTSTEIQVGGPSLNRAIVECVAKMQAAKTQVE